MKKPALGAGNVVRDGSLSYPWRRLGPFGSQRL